jgi:hypothetical protein
MNPGWQTKQIVELALHTAQLAARQFCAGLQVLLSTKTNPTRHPEHDAASQLIQFGKVREQLAFIAPTKIGEFDNLFYDC